MSLVSDYPVAQSAWRGQQSGGVSLARPGRRWLMIGGNAGWADEGLAFEPDRNWREWVNTLLASSVTRGAKTASFGERGQALGEGG